MKVKARKTLLKYIGELANRGFINYEEFEKIKEKIGIDFGSGYPSDPLTREFLLKKKTGISSLWKKKSVL